MLVVTDGIITIRVAAVPVVTTYCLCARGCATHFAFGVLAHCILTTILGMGAEAHCTDEETEAYLEKVTSTAL